MSARSRSRGGSLLAALAMAGTTVSAPAHAEDAFLRFSGSTPVIVGESVVPGYENWIELSAASWNVTAASSWTKGGGASVGKPNPGEMTWTQTFDTSVPSMLYYIGTGHAVALATLELVTDGKAGPATYMQLAMTGVFFTGISFDGDTAFGSVVFKTVTQSLWPLNADGTRGTPVTFTWDIPAGTVGNSGALAGFVAGYGPGNLSPIPAPVPEPATYVLMVAGLLLIGVVARGRKAG